MPEENVIKEPNAPATSRQTWAIRTLGGGDVRGENLTRAQASERIQALLNAKGVTPQAPRSATDDKFGEIIKAAGEAANAAGDKWLETAQPMFRVVEHAHVLDDTSPIVKDHGTILDVCAIVYIAITDRRTAFARWVKKTQNGRSYSVRIPFRYSKRQERGLLEACYGAAIRVLRENGIDCVSLYSRID